MTDDESPRAPTPWVYALLFAGAAGFAACTVTLGNSHAPNAPAPTRTATPRKSGAVKRGRQAPSPSPTVSPSPIPRLSHLDVPADDAGAALAPAAPNAALGSTSGSLGSTSGSLDAASADGAPVSPAAAAPSPAVATPAAAVGPVSTPERALLRATGSAILERRGDLLVTAARLNGQPLGDLLLDTGAGGVFIDQRIADEHRLPEMIAASTEGAKGEASIRELAGLAIGDLALTAERAFVIDLRDGPEVVGTPLAGVIGLAALGTSPFTLDFTTGTLTIETDATFDPPSRVSAEALRMDQGLPFVEATLSDGSPVWLLLDTGSAAAITVWRGFAKQHPGVVRSITVPAPPAPLGTPDPAAPLPTATPEPPRSSELRGFRIFGEKYDRIPVLVQDPPPRSWQRARVVGRVGMALLRDLRITIHPATERIWAERLRPPNSQ